MKNFDDLNNDKSLFLTQSYLKKGGFYQKQLQYQQQMEQENRIAREQLEQQKKYIEEKEQIELDVSRPIQINDELVYLAQTIKNSDSAEKNSGINNLINNRKIAKSYSIISQKPQTNSDLQNNIQINGEASIKSQYPNSNVDLDLDRKKVNTEVQFGDQDDKSIDANSKLDLQINVMERSKQGTAGNCSVQTAYFKDKNSMSINHNQPSSFFPNNRLDVVQNNQISKFALSQNNINLVRSEIDDYEDYDTAIDEAGDFSKAQMAKYQFSTKQSQLKMKKEQIFNRINQQYINNKASQNMSFCVNNSNHLNNLTFASHRNGSSDQLPNSARGRFTTNNQAGGAGGQNMFQFHQSKELSFDLASSQAKQNNTCNNLQNNNKNNNLNNKDQNGSQIAPYSFMQSHGIHDSSHNSTSDVLSQQQQFDNNTQNHIDKQHIQQCKENIFYNKQQDYLIILSNASFESESNSHSHSRSPPNTHSNSINNSHSRSQSHPIQPTQRDQKKEQIQQPYTPILEENILETNRSTLSSFSRLDKRINETIPIHQARLIKHNNNKSETASSDNNFYYKKQNSLHQRAFSIAEDIDETFEKEKITKHQFEVLSPNLSQKREQIFNPSSKKGSANNSFSSNSTNNNNYNCFSIVEQSGANQIQLFSPQTNTSNTNTNTNTTTTKAALTDINTKAVTSNFNPTQNILQYTYTKNQIDKLITEQSKSNYKSQQSKQQVLPFSIKNQSHETTLNNNKNNTSKNMPIFNSVQQPTFENLQIDDLNKNHKIE